MFTFSKLATETSFAELGLGPGVSKRATGWTHLGPILRPTRFEFETSTCCCRFLFLTLTGFISRPMCRFLTSDVPLQPVAYRPASDKLAPQTIPKIAPTPAPHPAARKNLPKMSSPTPGNVPYSSPPTFPKYPVHSPELNSLYKNPSASLAFPSLSRRAPLKLTRSLSSASRVSAFSSCSRSHSAAVKSMRNRGNTLNPSAKPPDLASSRFSDVGFVIVQ